MLSILLCDDEEINLDLIGVHIKNFFKKSKLKYQVVGFHSFGEEMMSFVEKEQVDIAFLDIDFKSGYDGFYIAQKLVEKNKNTIIIFVTNHLKYAWNAYDILALGYLQKPIVTGKFNALLKKALLLYQASSNINEGKNWISVGKKLVLQEKSILAAEKVGKKIVIYKFKEKAEGYCTMIELKNQLHMSNFIVLDRSTLLNMKYITEINGQKIKLANGSIFFIPEGKSKTIMSEFNEYTNSLLGNN